MQSAADARGMRLRPHAKTHKSPELARLQIDARRRRHLLRQARRGGGVRRRRHRDIRLPYPLNPINADRVVELLDRDAVSFIVDHLGVARGWSEAMRAAGRDVDVLVKVDVGFHRCGIDPDAADAASWSRAVAALPGLRFRGLLSHAGHALWRYVRGRHRGDRRSGGRDAARPGEPVAARGVDLRGDQRRRDADRAPQRCSSTA